MKKNIRPWSGLVTSWLKKWLQLVKLKKVLDRLFKEKDMKRILMSLVVLSVVALSVFGCMSMNKSERKPAELGAATLKDKDILEASSSMALELSEGYLINDNDGAFQSKVDAIEAAQPGDTISMSYYIYQNDHSSSVLNNALLEAAARGVKIRIIVDYLTNYKNLDLYYMLEAKGSGNIEVRLYGRPNEMIVRDALFLTRPCPAYKGTPEVKLCADNKWNGITAELKNVSDKANYVDYFSSLFLSGLSSKNGFAMQTAIFMGGQFDPKKMKEGGGETSPEDQKKLKEFFGLVYDAKMHGNLISALKVNLALAMYGDKLKPLLNEIYGRLPLTHMEGSSGKDWEHVSDFTHHKLLLVTDSSNRAKFFQLGGRNIENSYHMKKNELSAKYTFIDTDFAGVVKNDGGTFFKAFDHQWEFKPMIVRLKDVEKFAPFDFIGNPVAAKKTVGECNVQFQKGADRAALAKCLSDGLWKNGGKDRQTRIEEAYANLKEQMDIYNTKYRQARDLPGDWRNNMNYAISIPVEDLKGSLITYIENIHHSVKRDPGQRKYGTVNGFYILPWKENEQGYGRYLHWLWHKGMENTCAASAKDGQARRIVLHNAYFLPPSNMMRTFAKMIDGTWDCRNVTVIFLTNSFETTDLNVINVYARYQMTAFFEFYNKVKAENAKAMKELKVGYTTAAHEEAKKEGTFRFKRSANFEYYEYNPIKNADGSNDEAKKISLHTKVTVMGDDIIIGSANADIRSFYMDTNNGVYIRNAKGFLKKYNAWLDRLMADKVRSTRLTGMYVPRIHFNREELHKQDEMFLGALMKRFHMDTKLDEPTRKDILDKQKGLTENIFNTIKMVMSTEYVELPYASFDEDYRNESEKVKKQDQMIQEYNRSLQLL
jgi:cardiolipin synthase C